MANTLFSIKPLLETIFKILNKSTNYFADAYLLKNVSLVSKWKTGKVIPKNEDISKIVEFVNNESTGMQRHLIRNKLEELINESSLDVHLKSMLLRIEDFSVFLTEVLILSVSDTAEKSESETLVYNEVTEELPEEEVNLQEVLSDSHRIQRFFKAVSKNLHKTRIKKVFLVIALCVAILIFFKFITNKDLNNSIYVSNPNLSNESTTIELSDKYFMSYTRISDSGDEVQVDINSSIPIQFRNASPLLFDNVLYLPFGDVFMNMGFSFVDFNGSTKVCKEMRTGQTVIAKVGTKELQVNDKIVKLSDSIRMGKYDLYIPAYSLKNFTSYLDRMIPQNIDIKIDSKDEPQYRNPPRIVDGVLYLSFRYIFEKFKYNVMPDRTTQKETERAIAVNDIKKVEVEEGKDYAILNGNPIPLSSAVFVSGNITYVPVDIIKQVLNIDYKWDKDNRILEITTGKSK